MTITDSPQLWSVTPSFADAGPPARRLTSPDAPANLTDPAPAQGGGTKDFSRLIGRIMKSGETARQREEKVYRNVEELVAQTLVAPVLAKLREDPLESGLFKKTHGEKALRPLIEAEVAKDIVHNMRTGLVDQMARRLLNPQGSSVQASGRRMDAVERRS